MPEPLPATLVFHVPADLSWVRAIRKMSEALLTAQGWDGDTIEDAALVLTELVQNAIEHGTRARGDERVRVAIALEAEELVLDVSDPGTGKDPAIALTCDPTCLPPLEAPRGRGLYLVHRLSKELRRMRQEQGGLRVVVRIRAEGT